MIRAAFLTLGLAVSFASPLAAQVLNDCDWQASVRNLVEPWAENTRTFAKGAVRVALLDTVEPAAGAFHLLVLSPPLNELGERQCRTVSFAGGIGYAGMDFSALGAEYVQGRGLVLTLPAMIYSPEEGFANSAMLDITINQATGQIDVSQELGRE